jgi:hypothetical protein
MGSGIMKIHTEYYFEVDPYNVLLRNNERYRFILEDFESEELALDAMRKLGEMFEKDFSPKSGYNFSLELRKKIRIERE